MEDTLTLELPLTAAQLETTLHKHCDARGNWDTCRILTPSDLDEYQVEAMKTDCYPDKSREYDHLLGLASEAGEVCGKVKKIDRDYGGKYDDIRRGLIADELGDVLWYVAAVATDLKMSLREVAERNLAKLRDRADRGVIKGEGDNR